MTLIMNSMVFLFLISVQRKADILEDHITSAQLAAYFCWLNVWLTLKP
jgi:hypothetical protein